MAGVDNAIRSAVPGGGIAKPLMIALGALLASGVLFGKGSAGQSTSTGTRARAAWLYRAPHSPPAVPYSRGAATRWQCPGQSFVSSAICENKDVAILHTHPTDTKQYSSWEKIDNKLDFYIQFESRQLASFCSFVSKSRRKFAFAT
jgi:hypothetical protein